MTDQDSISVWAFAQVPEDARMQLYLSVKEGKSRFGWSTEDNDDLRTSWSGEQAFLLRIKSGDWIVHVNLPNRGECTAVRATGQYGFDEGLKCSWDVDYRHYIPVDAGTVITFERRSPNIVPTVNLRPRARYHQIRAVADFLESMDNVRFDRIKVSEGQSGELMHLKNKASPLLNQITVLLQRTHKSKSLEGLIARVLRKMPHVVNVEENGFGWGTDHGADLIVTMQTGLGNLQFERKIVVQVKSFEGSHSDLHAVEQVIEGIKFYNADAGMIITTGESTEALETEIATRAAALAKPIDLIAGKDVAKFVLQNDLSLVFGS